MVRKFRFGKENWNGTPIPAVFDEKNLTTDWLTEFLFEGNAIVNPEYSDEILGFVRLSTNRELMPCKLTYSRISNYLRYDFLCIQTLRIFDVDIICEKISQYFADSDYLDIELSVHTIDFESDGEHVYDTSIVLDFYHRT